MFNNKKSLVKLTAGIGLSTALLLGGSVTSNVFPSSTVEAASSYKVTLRHNAYVYNYKGYRIRKASLKKGKILKVYRSKNINGKKYLYIGKHQYIKSANASKYNSKNQQANAKSYLFTVKVNPGSDLYTAPNGNLSNWSMENTQRVYEVTKDSKGETWYKLAKKNWIKSTDTNRPVTNEAQNNATTNSTQNNTVANTTKNFSNPTVSNTEKQTNEETPKTNNTIVQELATPQYASEIAQSFITQLNEVRQKMGKGTLSLDANINDFANIRSNELLTQFSHVRPDGSSFNYSECISMEMIDKNTTPSQAAKKVLDRFLYDDASWNWEHRDILLDNDCNKIGVGVSWEPKPGTSWNNYRFPEYMGFRMAVDMK